MNELLYVVLLFGVIGFVLAEQIRNSDNYTEKDFNDAFFNTGGFYSYASTLYSSLVGPALETLVPYRNDEGVKSGTVRVVEIVKEPEEPIKSLENLENYVADKNSIEPVEYYSQEELDALLGETLGELSLKTTSWYKGSGKYYFRLNPMGPSSNGTWTVDESLRFAAVSELEGSRILPSPSTCDENGAYIFNETGLNAIKQELVSGRAVSIAYLADQSRPGDPIAQDSTMNFLDADGNPTDEPEKAAYWCQYTFDTTYDPTNPESINHITSINHGVTIVGYDDTIPKEYFNDPNGTIGGDGAFIVKNSWGSKELDGKGWGNNGEGYFYLSYYDQSIRSPESFDFRVLTDERVQQEKYSAVNLDMYDLLPSNTMDEMAFDTRTSMANVFTARKDSELRSVGYTAVSCNETVSYDIYILNEDATSPTDGVLAGHAEEVYPYAGYQRTDLETPVIVREGQKYSIVVTVQREDGCYGVGVRAGTAKTYYDKVFSDIKYMEETAQDEETRKRWKDTYDNTLQSAQYAVGVINPGESFLLADDTWTDWADMTAECNSDNYGQYIAFDNFSIKAYADSEILNVVNEIKEPQEQYQAGDVVEGQVTVTNYLLQDMGDFTFKLNDADWTTVDSIPSMESIVLPYEYTVTAEDLENGFFTTTVSAFVTQDGKTAELNLIDGFSTTVAKVSLKNEQETTEQPTETPTEQPETDAPTETTPAAEATYTADRLCEMALKDYEVRTGVKPETAESTAAENGKVVITLKDKDGNVLDTYTVDEKTALGTCSSGEVNLPQTGNHNPSTAAAAAGSVAAVMAGLFFAMKSGVFRRKD